ncbi:MAG: hypothetical protein KDK64_07085 [Chlamydiia bacterium]|nr:hypothetical protein [Chlamydiia bacterium]
MQNVSVVFTAHDLYVGAYECLGAVTSNLWNRLPSSFPGMQTLSSLKDYSTQILYDGAVALTVKTLQLSNVVLRHPQNETRMRSCRPELRELFEQAKTEILSLSNDCSIVFGHKVIFSKIPTAGETQEILDKLYQFQESAGILSFPKEKAAAKQAIATCFRLQELHQQIMNLTGEDISSKDLEAFQASLKQNILLGTSIGATVENIGEMVGGAVIDESSMVLPKEYNPAVFVGRQISEYIGKPLGRYCGTFMGTVGIFYLLDKLPLMKFEDQRQKIQFGAVLLMLAIEYMHWNPLTNYLEDASGGMAYDLGFYSIALLFNYIGMYMAGTGETLGGYAKNMTPSMLTYHGANFALDTLGFGGWTTSALSFYLSHVAYNFETYKSLFEGHLLSESFDSSQIGALVDQQEIRAARSALTSMLLKELSNRVSKMGQPALEGTVAQGVQQAVSAVIPQNALLYKPVISRIEDHAIQEATENLYKAVQAGINAFQKVIQEHPELAKSMEQIEQVLREYKHDLSVNDSAILLREFNAFFKIIRSPKMRQLIQEHKEEMLTIMHQSKPNNLDTQGPSNSFTESRQRILEALLGEYFGDYSPAIARMFEPVWGGSEASGAFLIPRELENILKKEFGVSPRLLHTLKLMWDPHFKLIIDPSDLRVNVERILNVSLETLYPLVPASTPEDEACSVQMMDLILRAMLISVTLRLATGSIVPSAASKLSENDYLEFLSSVTEFVFDLRHPSESLLVSLQKAGICCLVQSQLRSKD